MQMEESIFNLVPKPAPPAPPRFEYKSKFPGNVPPTASTFAMQGTSAPGVKNVGGVIEPQGVPNGPYKYEKTHATFGTLGAKPDPQAYLKGRTKMQPVDDLKTTKAKGGIAATTKPKTKLKPELPKDKPVCNLVSNKNFIVANAVETILAQPKKTEAEGQDYLRKEDYGKVPAYLQRIKEDIAAEYEYIKKLQQEQEEQQKQQVRLMSIEEREELVNGLKAKWESVNHEYQMHTHLTKLDTIGKIKRKERCETMLDALEKDLQKLKKQHIYVDTRQ